MPNISFTGLGSSIDFGMVRDAIVAERMRPIALLQAKSASYGNKSDALKQLNGVLANLTNNAQALTDSSLGTGRTATSSASNVTTVSATSEASFGSYNLNVNRLASRLSQTSTSFPTATSSILAGGATTATFELRKGGATSGTEITISPDNDSLEGLRDAINAADAGVTAAIVDISGNGSQYQLVLSSKDTGAASRVELVETTATGTQAALNIQSLNPPGATNDFSALDAQLQINGLTITRSNNSISNAITGLTLNLNNTGTTTVTVAKSNDITTKVQTFIYAYNAAQDLLNGQYQKDSTGRPTGVLAGDPTLRTVQQQMRDALSVVSNNGGNLKSLTDLGIGRDTNGKLTLDSTKLDKALDTNLEGVRSLLFGSGSDSNGIFTGIHTAFKGLSDDVTGTVQNAITGYKNSIQNLSKSIADQTDRISSLRDSLTRQFSIIDSTINGLNSQGSTLTTILDSLKPKSR